MVKNFEPVDLSFGIPFVNNPPRPTGPEVLGLLPPNDAPPPELELDGGELPFDGDGLSRNKNKQTKLIKKKVNS